jgi:hypothetical protein
MGQGLERHHTRSRPCSSQQIISLLHGNAERSGHGYVLVGAEGVARKGEHLAKARRRRLGEVRGGRTDGAGTRCPPVAHRFGYLEWATPRHGPGAMIAPDR